MPDATPDPSSDAPPSGAMPTKAERLEASLEAEIQAALGGVDVRGMMAAPMPARETVRMEGGRRIRRGKIFRVTKDDIFVEFGATSQGVCPARHFETPPQEGDSVDFVVERLDPFENLLVLARPGVTTHAEWDSLAIGQIVPARCIGLNRGGLDMEVAHHKAFMPAAHVDVRHIEDLSVLLGQKLDCEIIELKPGRGRLVLSRRKVVEQERRQARDSLLKELKPGQTRTVTITSVKPFGAFADLGGVDGLIPIGELAHERIADPNSVIKVGDTVDVKVLRIERQGAEPRITLSRKQAMSDPAIAALKSVHSGDVVTVRVSRLTEFGAFVELSPGVEGLVHVTEITHEKVFNPLHTLKIDQVLEAKILSVEPARKRIALSFKALKTPPVKRDAHGREERREVLGDRADDPAMRKLRAKFGAGGQLKGGLGL